MVAKNYEQMKKEIKQELLEEFVLPILRDVKDREGEYREDFVKKVVKARRENPAYTYDSKTFLRQIEEE